MNKGRYYILSIVIILAQMVLTNYLDLSVFVTLCFLPTIVLSAPASIRTIPLMIVAFVFGLFYNFFADGMTGLASASLLPVAALRGKIVSLMFGENIFLRREGISIGKHGFGKVLVLILICNLVYFCSYVPLEAAGTREPAFLLIKITLSCLASSVVSLLAARILD